MMIEVGAGTGSTFPTARLLTWSDWSWARMALDIEAY